MTDRPAQEARYARKAKEWPTWIDDILHYGPLAELETEWRAEMGDAIVRVLDLRAGLVEVYNCADCGAARYRNERTNFNETLKKARSDASSSSGEARDG